MNNILVDALPITIEISGSEYEINPDFRNCLKIILAYEDPDLALIEKAIILVELLYKERPPDLQEAILKGVIFLNGGNDDRESSDFRLFSFKKDARLVMAGFRQTYQIDLQKEEGLHWWTFLTLFMDLSPDSTFSNMVGLRRRMKTGKATEQERKLARDLGDAFTIDDFIIKDLDILEKERLWEDSLGKGK